MKFPHFHSSVATAIALAAATIACDPAAKRREALKEPEQGAAALDIPLLPVEPGMKWVYQANLEIPEGVTSDTAAAVHTKFERVRTYLGKVAAAENLPQTDCFEVEVPGSPREREFVEIHPDRILMRGSLIMRPDTTHPMWLDPPVPFVIAGMKPGTALPEIKAGDGSLTRRIQVIAREDVTVPAGTFPCIRILTTGRDGSIETRRTIWFSPGNGIIREEKTQYLKEKLINRQVQELVRIERK